MPSFRFSPLLCGAILLMCTACAPSHPPQASISDKPHTPEPSISTSTSSAVSPTPDESSVPALFVPEPPAPAVSDAKKPSPATTPQPDPAPQTPEPEQPVPEEPVPAAPPVLIPSPTYDFSQPVPESPAVETDYFSDAAFVGDSRSEGFYLYGVKKGKNLSSSGLSVFTFAKKKTFTIGGSSYTGLEALALKEYAKVYLGFGVNELGYINADAFYRTYCETIDAVRACQPRAVIYAQTMAPVNESRVASSGGAGHLNNDRVRLYNDLIRKAAAEKHVPLLDIYSALAVDGSLPADASRDGIHLTGDYCRKQLEYLTTHTVSFDTLYSPPETEPEVLPDETSDIPVAESAPDSGPDSLLPEPEPAPLPDGSAPAASGI